MGSEFLNQLRSHRDLFHYEDQTTTQPPVFHVEALEEMLSEARDNAARSSGPMQHLAIVGDRGSGKTFLTYAFACTLGVDNFRGKVALLPELQPHIQSPENFIQEVLKQVEGDDADITGGWEHITSKLDKMFSARSRSKRLLVVVAENYADLIKRAFPEHADQAKLRNWLDRAESRVMFITTSVSSDIDGEPGEPLFGFLGSVKIGAINAKKALLLVDDDEEQLSSQSNNQLFSFLFQLTDQTPKAANILARSYQRYGQSEWRSIVVDFQRYYASSYEQILEDLGQRAAVCMHDMIAKGEPVSQSQLAKRLGFQQQSAVAQPFAEMRRKHLLKEEPAPNSRAKLASFSDRFFVSFYRQKVMGIAENHDLPFILSSQIATSTSKETERLVKAIHRDCDKDGRAAGYKTFSSLWSPKNSQEQTLSFASALLAKIADPNLLNDIAERIAAQDPLSAALVSHYAECIRKDDPINRWSVCQPDMRAYFFAHGLT